MIKRLSKSDFFGPVLTIMSGSTLAQLIPLFSEILIVRLFSPVELGILALFLAVATLFSAVATGRYEMAIVLPRTDDKAINVLALSLFITLLISIFSGLIVWLFGEDIARLAGSEGLIPFLKWVPLFVLVSGFYQSFNQWATRKRYYKNIAASKISQSSSNAAISLGTGFAGMNALGLIWGQIAGWFMGSMPLFYRFWRRDQKLIPAVNKTQMLVQAKEYSDFPKINSAHILSDIGQQSLLNFIISRFFGDHILGFYSRMIRIVKVPAGFIGAAVGQVFYQKASEVWHQHHNIRPLLKKQMIPMLALGLPIFTLLALFGPAIFGFVLGEDWMIAGTYAQFLSPWLFLNFLISPFTSIPLIVGRQSRFFLLSLGMNISVILAFITGYYLYDAIEAALIMVSVFQVVFHLYLAYWFYQISAKHPE